MADDEKDLQANAGDNAGVGETTTSDEPAYVAPTPPNKLPPAQRPKVDRKPGEVFAGDFIVYRNGTWFYCENPGAVDLSPTSTTIAVALAKFSYDPSKGAANQSVRNIAVAQFWQDASKSPFCATRKQVAEVMQKNGIAVDTIKVTLARMPEDPVPDLLAE